MSISLLSGQAMGHGVSDDLESVYWVLLYLVLRYRPIANLPAPEAHRTLKTLFDYHLQMGGQDRGGVNKEHFLADGRVNFVNILTTLAPSIPVPVLTILTELTRLFRFYYAPGLELAEGSAHRDMIAARDAARARLATHKYVMTLILASAQHPEWATAPQQDGAKDQIAHLVKLMDTPQTATRIDRESASSALSQVSATSGTSKGSSRGKRPRGSDVNDAPRKKGRGAPSSHLESVTTSTDVVQGGDADGPPDAEDASNVEEDSADEEDREDDAEDEEGTEENVKDEA